MIISFFLYAKSYCTNGQSLFGLNRKYIWFNYRNQIGIWDHLLLPGEKNKQRRKDKKDENHKKNSRIITIAVISG